MKNVAIKILITLLLNAFAFASLVAAEDLIIPIISRPAVLDEGVQRELTPVQIAEILPWTKDSKLALQELLENIQTLKSQEKVEKLVEGIEVIVSDSASTRSELLMRYILNRSLILYRTLSSEMREEAVGSVDVKLRVLSTSVSMALDYSNDDVLTLTSSKKISYAMFGKVYYSFLYELNKSIFDTSAQYQIQKMALEWYQWDLYRDINNKSYSSLILKINNALKLYPVNQPNDSQAINFIKQMKNFSIQSELSDPMLINKVISPRINKIKKNLEVGDKVYFFNVPPEMATITKVLDDNRYNVTTSSRKYKAIPRSYFIELSGCGNEYCVNDELLYESIGAFNAPEKEKIVSVIGIRLNGDYLIKYKNRNEFSYASDNTLNQQKGCRNNFCVGDKVTVKSDPTSPAEIIQINGDGCVVKFYESHWTRGFDISYKDLQRE